MHDQRGKPLADAVVTAMPIDERLLQKAKPPADAVDQVDKQFVPYVKVIMRGSSVQFPNSDHIRHQVYSFSPTKSFELPLYGNHDAPRITFDEAGVVVLGCNIHDWMLGYIYVASTPFFGKTNAQGVTEITNLPSGLYQLKVWHPGLERTEDATLEMARVSEDAVTPLDWQVAVKTTFHVPRMSGGTAAGYP